MSSEERGRRGNALRGGARRHPVMSNACDGQRSSGHLAVLAWSTTRVGGGMMLRTSWEGNQNGLGCIASERLSLTRLGKAFRGKPRSKPESGNPTFRDCRGARGNVTLSAITWCARLGSIPTPGTGSFHPVAIETAVGATKLSELSMERVANRRQRAPPVVCLQTVQRLPKFPSHFRSGCAKCVQNVTFVLCLRFRARR